jgi:choloylglycine hydrolase
MHSIACTTFLLQKDGKLVFGRNYDWISGAGIVHTNQRGLFKTSTEKQSAISWVSLYGSMTFNQYGKEFPTGGMNEQGLVVELMWLDGTKYPAPDERPAVSVLQWIQYQLDMHTTVDEIIKSDKKIRINDRATPLHFLIADSKGHAATIEFLHGEMIVHTGDKLPFPVLTNDTYATSVQSAERAMAAGNMPGNNSLDRFVTACKMVHELKTSDTKLPLHDYAFSILDKVAQGNFTKWSIVYDITIKTVYFKTADFASVKTFSFSAFDFACSVPAKMFDMNQAGRGDVAASFILPDKKIKQAALEKATRESSQYVSISEAEKKLLLEFEESIHCKRN